MTVSSPLTGTDRGASLDYLIAKEAIRECTNRYGRGLDRHDVETILSAFHPDAVDRHGSFQGNREELAEWGNAVHEQLTQAHSHFLMNHNVTIEGETAGSELYVMFVLRARDEDRVLVGGGRYLDQLERRDAGWRIVERTLVLDWMFAAESPHDLEPLLKYPRGSWDSQDLSYAVLARA